MSKFLSTLTIIVILIFNSSTLFAMSCGEAVGEPLVEIDSPQYPGTKLLKFTVNTTIFPVVDGKVEFIVTLPKHRSTIDIFEINGREYRVGYFRSGTIMLDAGMGGYVRHPNTDRNPSTGDLLDISLMVR